MCPIVYVPQQQDHDGMHGTRFDPWFSLDPCYCVSVFNSVPATRAEIMSSLMQPPDLQEAA